jgi:hypothetical protein
MTQNNQLSTRDLIDIAINGSQQFHTKSASSNDGQLQPDPVTNGHVELARQFQGLATLYTKAASYIEQGYPAKLALTSVADEAGIDSEFSQKLASALDELGEQLLKECVAQTYQNKVASLQKTAASPLQAALSRGAQLLELSKK